MDKFTQTVEANSIILARIDERVKSLTEKFEEHLKSYEAHIKQNDSDIRGLYKNQYIGYGVLLTLNFIIMFFKH